MRKKLEIPKKQKKFLKEFKTFALRGNMMDMAVGVIVGGAFGKIVTSIVNDVIMPIIGVLLGGFDFKTLKWVIKPAVMDGATIVKPEVVLTYGNFIQNVVDFLIIAFCVFLMVKVINKITETFKKEEPKKEPEPPKVTAEDLLTEIRDLLKEKHPEQDSEKELTNVK